MGTLLKVVRRPAYTAIALLLLGLAISAGTATFMLIDAVLLRPLPVEQPERLVTVSLVTPRTRIVGYSYPLYLDLSGAHRTLTGLAARATTPLSFTLGRGTERIIGEMVSGNYFDVLRVQAAVGRTLTPADDRLPGAHPVAVLSHAFWQWRLRGEPSILGKTIFLNGQPVTVVGVAAAGFTGIEVGLQPAAWIPLMMQREIMPQWGALNDRSRGFLDFIGRLSAGSAAAAAEVELAPVFKRAIDNDIRALRPSLTAERALKNQRVEVEAAPRGLSRTRRPLAQPLTVLAAAVGVAVVIAGINLARLLVSSVASIARSLTLSLAGGAFGLLAAPSIGRSLVDYIRRHASLPFAFDAALDSRALLFSLALSVLTGLLVACASLLRSPGRRRLWNGLVAVQVILSLILVVGAGLFISSLHSLRRIEPGYAREPVLLASAWGRIVSGRAIFNRPARLF